MNVPWPAEDEAILRRLWDRGLSASEIGTRVGKTRNAVLGKVHRLGLSSRAAGAPRKAVPVLSSKREERRRRMAEAVARQRDAAEQAAKRPGNTHYDDLTPWSCRWIPGDPQGASTLYCGDAVEPGKSYCQHHLAKMFRVISPAQNNAELKRFARAAA